MNQKANSSPDYTIVSEVGQLSILIWTFYLNLLSSFPYIGGHGGLWYSNIKSPLSGTFFPSLKVNGDPEYESPKKFYVLEEINVPSVKLVELLN